jgi:hypothetical protein
LGRAYFGRGNKDAAIERYSIIKDQDLAPTKDLLKKIQGYDKN